MDEIEELKKRIADIEQALNDKRFLEDVPTQTVRVIKTSSPGDKEDYEQEVSGTAAFRVMGRPDRWEEVTIDGKHYRRPLYFRTP